MKKACLLLVFLFLSLAATAQQASADAAAKLQGLDAFVEQLRSEWKVPGLALGVVQDGKVVMAKGYGYRDLEQQLPFTTKTLFPIGSTSKSFTALSLAILRDQGKLDWDDRVRRYLPFYELQDPVASERMTIRDLLLHRSGLARHDMVWYSSDFTMKQVLDRLKYLDMGKGFRNIFQYNNLGYMTAGYLAGEVDGHGWEHLVRERIFVPLDMKASNFSDAESEKTPDYALPYDVVDEKIQRIPFASTQGVAPAGAIHSTMDDMLHYAEMLLADGKYDGKQVVSEANLKTIQSPQILMGVPSPFAEMGAPAYGMGWAIQSYRGHRYVWHNGGIDGFYTLLALLPDDHLGVIVFTHRLDRAAAEVLARNVFDRMLGMQPVDWDQRYREASAKAKAAGAEEVKKIAAERKPGTHPAHPLADYAGTYLHPAYGTVTVSAEGDHLVFKLNRLSAPLEHYHYEVFIVPQADRVLGSQRVRFETGMSGAVDEVAVPLEDGVREIVFQRVKPDGKAGKPPAGGHRP
jgi:CubicO group peptidase (beta-lactamase class C family)